MNYSLKRIRVIFYLYISIFNMLIINSESIFLMKNMDLIWSYHGLTIN